MPFSFMKRDNTASVPTLSPTDFLAQREADAVVLDVRTPGEFAEGHLAGVEHIDFMNPSFRDRVDALDRDATYYLYCRSGNRSGKAAELMQEMGFSDVTNIGGYEGLAAAGAETER